MMQTKPMVSLPEAIKSCLRQYVGFHGRATRAEYWWWMLVTVVVTVVVSFLSLITYMVLSAMSVLSVTAMIELFVLSWLVGLAVLLPWLAVTARRLHDIGRTGWWQLVWRTPGVLGVLCNLSMLMIVTLTPLGGMSESMVSVMITIVILLLISNVLTIALAVWEIWWMVKQGQAGPNRHGPDPRALDTPA